MSDAPHPDAQPGGHAHNASFLALCVSAAGVVFGDIGTSPLYTWSEIRAHGGLSDPADVLGVCSLIVWTLTLVVAVKYVLIVLRADNHGEGGTFALMGLLEPLRGPLARFMALALVGASCLLYGDGLITPAISVLGAVEGLAVASPALAPLVVPLALGILTALFSVQHHGTEQVGRWFGGVMVAWFAVIAFLGGQEVVRNPHILEALSPHHALRYLAAHGLWASLPTLGAVVLCTTGGEALYADMGHFGARAIRWTWWALTYPCLLLNYLGQGALLHRQAPIPGDNVFFAMVPPVALLPMVGLATLAAVIASQALISGAFSLTRAAINLGWVPRVRVVHTSSQVEGQIYMPAVNWALWAGCCGLVVAFGSSHGLAAAYGLAVMGVMLTTTASLFVLTTGAWGWPLGWASALFGAFALIDLAYLTACGLKLLAGGWMPLAFAGVLSVGMGAWRLGRRDLSNAYRGVHRIPIAELLRRKQQVTVLPRAMVFLTQEQVTQATDGTPVLLLKFLDRYGALPKHLTFFTVVNESGVPFWLKPRFDVVSFGENVVSVRMHVGYRESPDVRAALVTLKRRRLIKIHATHWTIVMGKEEILFAEGAWWKQARLRLFRLQLQLASQAHLWFGLGSDPGLSKEIVPVQVDADAKLSVVLTESGMGALPAGGEPA